MQNKVNLLMAGITPHANTDHWNPQWAPCPWNLYSCKRLATYSLGDGSVLVLGHYSQLNKYVDIGEIGTTAFCDVNVLPFATL